jgi:hypothetical protein
MPAAAAAPAIIGAIGAGASAAGSVYGAVKGQGTPNAVFPQANQEFMTALNGPNGLGRTSMYSMKEMARTGMPTNVGPMFEALVNSQQRFNEQGRGNILEKFGSMGLRYSKPALDAMVDYESQLNSNYGSILANYVFQAMESARGRQLAAGQTGVQAFGNAGMTVQGQRQPGQGIATAGESLMGLGTYFNALKTPSMSQGSVSGGLTV